MSSSTVTYTSVYTDFEPRIVYWEADEELSNGGSPRVIVYEYDRLPMQRVASPSLDYVPRPEHPTSPDYVPSLENPPSPVDVPYIHVPEHPEYLVPSEDEAPIEDQPLPTDASPTTLSPGYVADYDLDEDPEKNHEEDHADYLVNGRDGDDEPFNDDDDDDTDDDEEPFEDEDDDDEEEEHLAPADSSVVPVFDHVPSAGDTKSFETDESTPTPRSPQTQILFSQIRLCKARKTVRLEPPMSASIKARIAKHAAVPTPPLPISFPPLPLPSPLTTNPTDIGASLGYMEVGIKIRALLPSISHMTDVLEAEIPPQKRACFTTPASRLKVGQSSALDAARQPKPALEADLKRDRVDGMGYRITNTWDEIVEAMMEIAPTTLDRPFHRHTVMLLDREATYARKAWAGSEDRSAAIEAHVRTLEAHVATFITQTSSLQTQLTIALRCIETLKANDPKPQEEPAEAGSSCCVYDSMKSNVYYNSSHFKENGTKEKNHEGIVAALAKRDAYRSKNVNDVNDSGTGRRRQVSTIRECTYTNFLNCQPMNLKGTEGVYEGLEAQDNAGAIEFAIELMDKKILTITERRAETKRKFKDTSKNNQNQQQPFKRNNVARAYTVGPGEKKSYGWSKPLCPKCNYHHDGPCAPNAIFTSVASLFFWQWQLSSLAVETSSASGNSIAGSENALCILFPTILP
nr:hypothetical protein [Tanacetum cinerariifolium]